MLEVYMHFSRAQNCGKEVHWALQNTDVVPGSSSPWVAHGWSEGRSPGEAPDMPALTLCSFKHPLLATAGKGVLGLKNLSLGQDRQILYHEQGPQHFWSVLLLQRQGISQLPLLIYFINNQIKHFPQYTLALDHQLLVLYNHCYLYFPKLLILFHSLFDKIVVKGHLKANVLL